MTKHLYEIYHKREPKRPDEPKPTWSTIRRDLGIVAARPDVRQMIYDLEHKQHQSNINRDRVKTFFQIMDIAHGVGSQYNINTMRGLSGMMELLGYTDVDKLLGEVPFRDPSLQARLKLYLKRVTESRLTEAPISNWDIDPNMDRNEKAMRDQFVGYRGEKDHFDKSDRAAIDNPKIQNRVINAFRNVPQNINLFFWQIPQPDYDPFLQRGITSLDWIANKMDPELAQRITSSGFENAINIVFTNNLSNEYKINLRSPWIVAHRIAHTLIGGYHNESGEEPVFQHIDGAFERYVFNLMRYGYNYEWSIWNHYVFEDQMQIIKKEVGKQLGTMKSAREGKLVQAMEWDYETFTQYLITGDVILNPLPEVLAYEKRTNDPVAWQKAQKLHAVFPTRLKRWYDQLLNASVGKVFLN